MENLDPKTMQISALFSVIIISILNALITYGKEVSSDFKDFFTSITGHHWTGHGVVILILFLVFFFIGTYLVKSNSVLRKDMDVYKFTLWTVVILLLSDLFILVSYLLH